MLQALSDASGIRLVNLADFEPNHEVASLIPPKIAERLTVTPSVGGRHHPARGLQLPGAHPVVARGGVPARQAARAVGGARVPDPRLDRHRLQEAAGHPVRGAARSPRPHPAAAGAGAGARSRAAARAPSPKRCRPKSRPEGRPAAAPTAAELVEATTLEESLTLHMVERLAQSVIEEPILLEVKKPPQGSAGPRHPPCRPRCTRCPPSRPGPGTGWRRWCSTPAATRPTPRQRSSPPRATRAAGPGRRSAGLGLEAAAAGGARAGRAAVAPPQAPASRASSRRRTRPGAYPTRPTRWARRRRRRRAPRRASCRRRPGPGRTRSRPRRRSGRWSALHAAAAGRGGRPRVRGARASPSGRSPRPASSSRRPRATASTSSTWRCATPAAPSTSSPPSRWCAGPRWAGTPAARPPSPGSSASSRFPSTPRRCSAPWR